MTVSNSNITHTNMHPIRTLTQTASQPHGLSQLLGPDPDQYLWYCKLYFVYWLIYGCFIIYTFLAG
jgi:hypothetical protein